MSEFSTRFIAILAGIVLIMVPALTSAGFLYRELQLGMSGPDVLVLQAFLAKNKTVYPQGLVTGQFGPLTMRAIVRFQSQRGIPAVGRVGPMTLKAINAELNAVAAVNTGTTSPVTIGDTTLVVSFIPLLSGGQAKAGKSVPVSYLQVTNTGDNAASLAGFWLRQSGSAGGESIIGLTTVDDKGSLRGSVGGTEGSILFKDGLAFVPANATIAPKEMRLFTIKTAVTASVSSYLGKDIKIEVASVDTNAKVQGTFPIRGVTWTISN